MAIEAADANLQGSAGEVNWEYFAWPLRQKYGDGVVNDAITRVTRDDVFDRHGDIGVRLRAALGDNRSSSKATAYWPTGDGVWEEFNCRCNRMRRKRVCSHALAALMYRLWQEEIEEMAGTAPTSTGQ